MLFKTIKSSTEGGRSETMLVDSTTARTVCSGRMDEALVQLIIRDVSKALGEHPEICFYSIDGTAIEHWIPNIRGKVTEFLALLKNNKIKEITAVIPSSALRMFAAAITFASGVPMKVFATQDQEERYHRGQLDSLKKSASPAK